MVRVPAGVAVGGESNERNGMQGDQVRARVPAADEGVWGDMFDDNARNWGISTAEVDREFFASDIRGDVSQEGC